MNVIPTSLILLVKCNKGDTWKIHVACSNREHMEMYKVVTISLGLLLIIFISSFLGIKKNRANSLPFLFYHSFICCFFSPILLNFIQCLLNILTMEHFFCYTYHYFKELWFFGSHFEVTLCCSI